MAAIRITNRRTVNSIFGEVSQRNQSLDLVRLLDSGDDTCRSRFIEVPDRLLAVEVPSRRGHMVPVRKGERVEAYFRLKDRRYWFASQVESRSSLTLSADLKLPILILKRPGTLELRQRRRHYRVSLGTTEQLLAGLWLAADPAGTESPAELPSMEVLDLSAGGMRLLYPYGEGCPVDENDGLLISLPLSPPEPPVRLSGRVVRTSRIASSTTHIAVAFAELDDSPEGKMTRDKLIRFVTYREREELQRLTRNQ